MAEEKKAFEVEKEFARTGDGFSKKVTPEMIAKASLVADLMTIKVNDLRPWYETAKVKLSDTTAEIWKSQQCRPGQLIVLTHVSFGQSLHQSTTQEIAIERGGEKIVLNRDAPSAIDITLDWDGQVILTEGDRIVCTSFSGTANDILSIACSGYEIKA